MWQWVVQFGLGGAGFYSYEFLERLFGIPVTNMESIETQFQQLSVGDEIRLHPRAPGIPIALLDVHNYIYFGVMDEPGVTDSNPDPARSWSIYVESAEGNSCRLLLRGCIEPLHDGKWLKKVAASVEEPIDFVMEQRLLRTVKRLAERSGTE